MSKKKKSVTVLQVLSIVGIIVSFLVFLFGDNVFEQITGNSIFGVSDKSDALKTTIPESENPATLDIVKFNITVQADSGWQDTEIIVNEGDWIEIRYLSGKWNTGDSYPMHDGEGSSSKYICFTVATSKCAEPVPDAVRGTLIAKFSSSEPFAIGNYKRFKASYRSALFVAINDVLESTDLQDNTGAIKIEIKITTKSSFLLFPQLAILSSKNKLREYLKD